MNPRSNTRLNVGILAIILLGAATRFLPHPPNFTAIGAIALFGGAYFSNRKLAVLLPLVALFISDLMFQVFVPGKGFYPTMPFVYGSFILITMLGFYLRNKRSVMHIAGYSLISSVLFFFISNLGHWWIFYPKTVAGLTSCFALAIPFFHYTVLGDLFFNAAFFASAYYIFKKSVVSAAVNE